MVSDEEAWRTFERGDYYAIKPMLPELAKEEPSGPALAKEYSSGDSLITVEETRKLLEKFNLMVGQDIVEEGEFLR